jgi:Mrp family chromosome partitioning ATPase
LGLSYAASGCRTLLIDADLQAGGLSQRLGVSGEGHAEGVMNALVEGDLLEVVAETDVENLAILPVGKARGNQAGSFSPSAVRQLIAQAKRDFDVVLFDTGPLLGSIESTPIVASCDATILVVSRGQQRPTVEKALAHLQRVEAEVAGLVFNRASPGDFEKSVAGMNFRPNRAAKAGLPAKPLQTRSPDRLPDKPARPTRNGHNGQTNGTKPRN